MVKKSTQAKPECWCGCGTTVSGANGMFASGHDVKAALEAIMIDWGGVQPFVQALGYGPGLHDASLDVTYHEYMAKKSGRQPRKRRPVSK